MEMTMDALVKRMNVLCDALPFQTSWYLKDLKTGATADRMGDVPVPSASTRKISRRCTTASCRSTRR